LLNTCRELFGLEPGRIRGINTHSRDSEGQNDRKTDSQSALETVYPAKSQNGNPPRTSS